MILTKDDILKNVELGSKNGGMDIKPFMPENVGPNSLDVTLAKDLIRIGPLFIKHKDEIEPCCDFISIGDEGFKLLPNILYLGVTQEWTFTPNHIPIMHGRSSWGRVGLECHVCAGFGDIGFAGFWTLEIRVNYPTVVKVGDSIGQIAFHVPSSIPQQNYKDRPESSYNNELCKPMLSKYMDRLKC